MTINHIAGMTLIALGGYVVVFNWFTPYLSKRKNSNVSVIPIAGALLMFFGIRHFQSLKPYAWVAFFLDYGTLQLLLSLPQILVEMYQYSRFARIHEFNSQNNQYNVNIYLQNNKMAVLHIKNKNRKRLEMKTAQPIEISLVLKWTTIDHEFELENNDLKVRLSPLNNTDYQITWNATGESDWKYIVNQTICKVKKTR